MKYVSQRGSLGKSDTNLRDWLAGSAPGHQLLRVGSWVHHPHVPCSGLASGLSAGL